MALIMLGNGLQGSLLGLRASSEGFGVSVTGLVMSGYYIGLMAGAAYVPKIIRRVGHVRTFGALASLASTSVLIHLVFIDPLVWWVMRLNTGFAFAGLYIVAESWLNDAADNDTRGQLLSLYMLITLGGLAGGQFMLNIAHPDGVTLFVLISVLVSIAVIPILITVSKAPAFEAHESVSILQLYRVSPLGIISIFVSGMASGSIFGVGTVYAASIGLNVREISFFMGFLIIGGIVLQYPIGWLSDRIGRRKVITLVCLAGVAVFSAMAALDLRGWPLYAVIGLVGGVSLPLYSLSVAYTNDYLNPNQMVAASGGLVLANGLGAALGAPLTAFTMDLQGPHGFYQINAVALGLVGLFALWRATQRGAVELGEQGDFVAMAPSPISAATTPELDLEELHTAAETPPGDIQTSFDELIEDLENPQ